MKPYQLGTITIILNVTQKNWRKSLPLNSLVINTQCIKN